MQLETINKLYLELSQIATAQTAKEIALTNLLEKANSLCRSMHSIAERKGNETNWEPFQVKLKEQLEAQHKVLFAEK